MSTAEMSGRLPSNRGFVETRIPDPSLVSSCLTFVSQDLVVAYSQLKPYFEWIREQAKVSQGLGLMRKGALMTANNLTAGQERWDEIRRNERFPSLGRCIREDANSCFHRQVFYNLLMQEVGVPTASVGGLCVENDRANLREPTDDTYMVLGKGCKVTRSDEIMWHGWNMSRVDDLTYLVDAALLDKTGPKPEPIITEIAFDPKDPYTRVRLASGLYRHYVRDSFLEVYTQEGERLG